LVSPILGRPAALANGGGSDPGSHLLFRMGAKHSGGHPDDRTTRDNPLYGGTQVIARTGNGAALASNERLESGSRYLLGALLVSGGKPFLTCHSVEFGLRRTGA